MKRSVFPTTIVLLLLLAAACGKRDPSTWPPSDDAMAAMSEGIGRLERFEYQAAIGSFERAARLSPEWTAARVNLAIALLNQRGAENHARAAALCREILAADPDNLHANFILGTLLRLQGLTEEAVPLLTRVTELAPGDASAWYQLGRARTDLRDNEGALAAFERAVKLDPHLSAAHRNRSDRLRRLGRDEEAEASYEMSKRLSPVEGGKPYQANLVTTKAYHEIGTFGMAIRTFPDLPGPKRDYPAIEFTETSLPGWRYGGDGGPDLVPVPRIDGESDTDYVLRVASRIGPGVVLGDSDGDGDTDVFLPEWGGPGRLFRNDGAMKFTDVTAMAGLLTNVHGIAGCFFDADGDGDFDLYVTAAGPNVYYENDGEGHFTDRTAERGLGGGDVVSLMAIPADLDHEGDIDLWVASYARMADATLSGAPDRLFRNNRDGTFTDVAAGAVAAGGDARSLGALTIDIDRDMDTDLLVMRDRDPALLLVNGRFMEFTAGPLPPDLAIGGPTWGATAGDIDLDGREEILVFRGPAADPSLFEVEDGGRLAPFGGGLTRCRWRSGVFLDLDLNGTLDLIGEGLAVLDGNGAPVADPTVPSAKGRGIGFADFDGDGDLDRIVASHDGATVFRTDLANGNHWLALRLIGKTYPQPASWTSKLGADQEAEVRTARLWQPVRARVGTGFLSSIEPVVRFGLGHHDVAELVRILWPDRVLQVEVELSADAVHEIVEVNRKPTSCPLLFAWDGVDFRFVTDFLGVGGLGFLAEPGVYGASDPDEYVYVGDVATPVDGEYVFQLMEPLEEVTYLDEAALLVVDHPAAMEVRPNERFIGFPELFPEARIFGFETRIHPRSARGIDGSDITEILGAVDRVYAPIEPDRRFLGFAAEHAVTLDFTDRIPDLAEGERLVLLIDGWLEYGYSNDFYAAWQAKAPYVMPVIEVPDGEGGWRTVVENIGAPAGITKGMTCDLTGLITKETPVFRIRSTMEVFWDRITLGFDRGPGHFRVTRLAPTGAHLHHRGYPREFSPDGRMPLSYDYGLMDPGYTLKNIPGHYTRFGDVLPLVTETDDRTVLFGRGEEVTLRFPVAGLPPLPEGFRRSLIFYAAGWCKDRDPYTGAGDTVEPLPFRGMSTYPPPEGESYPEDNRAWIEEWNTRPVRGR